MKERLAITVRLQVGSAVHEVPGGNVRRLSLEMTTYGAVGTLEFVLQDDQKRGGKYQDDLLADFVKPDLSKLEISIQGVHHDNGIALERGEIVCGGIVLDRQVEEYVTSRVLDAPSVLGRRYRLTFCDPARALWRQHFPCELSTNKSFADVITAQQGTLAVTFDWDVIEQQVPLLFFHLDPERGVSFYDLVIWYLQTRQGVLSYDQRTQGYSLQAAKDAKGSAVPMASGELLRFVSSFPEVPRHVPRVKCSYSEAPTTTLLTNSQAASGVFRDVLLRTPIAKEVDSRAALEKSRPLSPAREVSLDFGRFPSDAPLPNTLFELPFAASTGPLSTPSEFRVFELTLDARALEEQLEVDYGDATTSFELALSARLEAKDELRVRLPTFSAPNFPGFLEGKVVSEVGAAEELTYQVYTDEATSVDNYHVKVPLFQDQI
ncbi:MAG TPA: hypothetical protein VJV79_35340, partial [Polyangiaceae bacterium]|nr:hypothetical protein [Polyangiaceae bacterium]